LREKKADKVQKEYQKTTGRADTGAVKWSKRMTFFAKNTKPERGDRIGWGGGETHKKIVKTKNSKRFQEWCKKITVERPKKKEGGKSFSGA